MLSAVNISQRPVRAAISVLTIALLVASCAGQRPSFATNDGQIAPPLELNLAPAPANTPPLPAASPDFPVEISVDDALAAWTRDRSIPYIDSCSRVTPEPGYLCDSPTERDTVRLLGPNAQEFWYVVTIAEESDLASGIGYRVDSVAIAGR